jgi:hypothetical protein
VGLPLPAGVQLKQQRRPGGCRGNKAEAPTTGHVQLVALGFTRKDASGVVDADSPVRGIAITPPRPGRTPLAVDSDRPAASGGALPSGRKRARGITAATPTTVGVRFGRAPRARKSPQRPGLRLRSGTSRRPGPGTLSAPTYKPSRISARQAGGERGNQRSQHPGSRGESPRLCGVARSLSASPTANPVGAEREGIGSDVIHTVHRCRCAGGGTRE